MTDNEIIGCLKNCRVGDCENCKALNVCDATFSFHKEALDLINRQKAEIEELEKSLLKEKLRNNMLYEVGNEIKSVTIKEFAERLKETCYTYSDICGYQSTVVDVNQIDNLVKEMTK